MQNAVRGATVHFQVQFFDRAGAPVASAATLSINFLKAGERTTVEVPMIFDAGNVWYTYDWETSADPDIQPGTVEWSVVSDTGDPPVYANQGCFEILANAANQGE